MIFSGDKKNIIIQRYDGPDSGPTVEINLTGDKFWINLDGADYYASQAELDRDEATLLRDFLSAWLQEQS